jgi:hypothetical protein
MKKMFSLLIDDQRTLAWADTHSLCGEDALPILKSGIVTDLYLDNDMGHGFMEGWEVAKWMVENDIKPERVIVVSSNPVAAERIREYFLHDLGYVNGRLRSQIPTTAYKASMVVNPNSTEVEPSELVMNHPEKDIILGWLKY